MTTRISHSDLLPRLYHGTGERGPGKGRMGSHETSPAAHLKGDNLLNAAVTGIKTRNPVLLRLLEWAVKLAGGTLRYWRSRPRREKKEEG